MASHHGDLLWGSWDASPDGCEDALISPGALRERRSLKSFQSLLDEAQIIFISDRNVKGKAGCAVIKI